MTIFSPHQSKIKFNLKLVLGAALLIIIAIASIHLQNSNMALRKAIGALESKIEEIRVANADYKNELYKLLDAKNLTPLIQRLGLVKEVHPRYLEGNLTVASQ